MGRRNIRPKANNKSLQHQQLNDPHHRQSQNDEMEVQASLFEGLKNYQGLKNQGATCYLNAVLQTLFMTEDFRKAIMETKVKKAKKHKVSLELQKLFQYLESRKRSVSTNDVTEALAIDVSEQQDASEYFQIILSKTEPKSAKIFEGKKKQSITCLDCHHEYSDEIPFFTLTVVMDSNEHKEMNIQKSFNQQFEEMRMDEEDQLYCEKCKNKRDTEMSCSILELPEVLTLHLQRFYLDYNNMTYRKNNRQVKIPLQLKVQEKKDVHHKYDLYAVVNHTGSLSGGHYYADIKSFENQQWYQFNDSTVHRIQNVYDDRYFSSDTACLLFFRKYQNNTNLPQQNMMQTDDENGHCSQSPVKKFKTNTKTISSQTMTSEPTPNTPLQKTDVSNDNQSKPDDGNSFLEANNHSEIRKENNESDADISETVEAQCTLLGRKNAGTKTCTIVKCLFISIGLIFLILFYSGIIHLVYKNTPVKICF